MLAPATSNIGTWVRYPSVFLFLFQKQISAFPEGCEYRHSSGTVCCWIRKGFLLDSWSPTVSIFFFFSSSPSSGLTRTYYSDVENVLEHGLAKQHRQKTTLTPWWHPISSNVPRQFRPCLRFNSIKVCFSSCPSPPTHPHTCCRHTCKTTFWLGTQVSWQLFCVSSSSHKTSRFPRLDLVIFKYNFQAAGLSESQACFTVFNLPVTVI